MKRKSTFLRGCLFIQACLVAALVMTGAPNVYSQETIKVSGTVVDESGAPLLGVSVIVEGTSRGTTVDAKGRYSISVPKKSASLTFSFLGYKKQTIPVNGRTKVDVVMQSDTEVIEDVVVVGYGTMQKRDITGAIASVSAEKIDQVSPVNVFDALQGQVAGMEVISGSGAPGEESVVRIRGTATFESGANPLYLVDGVVFDDIDDLNPSDIQSIEVLKDAASAAIYGSRSANGVILVTTKQGQEGKINLNIRYLRSYSQLAREMPKPNAAERKYYDEVRYRISSERNDAPYGYIISDTLRNFMNQDINLQDLLFRTAVRDEISLSASGATDKFNFFVSGGFLNEEGVIVKSDYRRFTARVNADYKPNKKLTVSAKAYFSYANQNGISESGVLNQLLERVPYWAIFNPDGSYVPQINNQRNPFAVAMTDVNKTQNYKANISDNIRYRITPHLTLNLNIQGVFSLRRRQTYRVLPQLTSSERSTGTDYSNLNYNWVNENYLNYKRRFKQAHTVEGMVGMSIHQWHREPVYLVGLDYTSDEIYTVNAASSFGPDSYSRIYKHKMVSYYGRVGYNYKSRYLFNANFRFDGSSRFGKDNRWGFFPSASVAWRFSDENFTEWMKPLVADGKLRVSYGVTGNESIPDYMSQLLYSPDYVYMGVAGIGPSNLGYDGLGWEETRQFNVGLDLTFKKNRFRLTADYYIKNTEDLLNRVEIAKESGFKNVYMNIGGMQNKGFEASLSATLIQTKDWTWNADANVSHNRAKIRKMAMQGELFKGNDDAIIVHQGGLLGEFHGYRYQGIYAYDESNAYTDNWQQLTPVFNNGVFSHYTLGGQEYTGNVQQMLSEDGNVLRGGDVIFQDTNGDGMIDSRDKQKIGCAQPDFYGGVSTTLRYKSFSLTAQLFYSIGGDIYNYAEAKRNRFRSDRVTPSPDAIRDMWTKPGDIARYPAPYINEHNMLAPSDFFLEDASYIKLKNVRLTWNLPEKWLKKVYLRSAAVYVYGKNLLTFTDYKGYDPEFASNSDPLVMGIDGNRYPRKREFGFGVNLGF